MKKILSILALLLTAVSGAWADSFSADAYAANATLNGVSVTANQTVTINEGVTVTVNNGLSIQSNATLTVTGGGTLVVNGTTGADGAHEYIEWDLDTGEEIFKIDPQPGGSGGPAITINNGGKLALSNATVIANGGQGGQGGQLVSGLPSAPNGADGNGFASFPTIEGAVLSYSTNGTDYTEYAPGNSTLYRYMKAVAAAPTYTATMKEGTEDAANWSITPTEGLNENDQVTLKYSGSNMVKSIKVKKVAAPEPDKLEFVEFSDGTNTVTVATMNLGATSVADGTSCYGDYYAWGATETFGTVAYTAYNAGTVTPTTGHDGGYSQDNAPYYENNAYIKYTSASDATLEAADDAVVVNMPGWHMPTQAEMQTLYAACGGTGEAMTPSSISDGDAYAKGIYWVAGATSSVTIGGDEYKANGILFVQDATHHVFFPATGNANGIDLYSAGSYGNYWYSSLRTEYISNAYRLNFRSNRVDSGNFSNRYYGFPVRPFKD